MLIASAFIPAPSDLFTFFFLVLGDVTDKARLRLAEGSMGVPGRLRVFGMVIYYCRGCRKQRAMCGGCRKRRAMRNPVPQSHMGVQVIENKK